MAVSFIIFNEIKKPKYIFEITNSIFMYLVIFLHRPVVNCFEEVISVCEKYEQRENIHEMAATVQQ